MEKRYINAHRAHTFTCAKQCITCTHVLICLLFFNLVNVGHVVLKNNFEGCAVFQYSHVSLVCACSGVESLPTCTQ